MVTQKELREIFDYHDDGKLVYKISTNGRIKIGDVGGDSAGKSIQLPVILGSAHALNMRQLFAEHMQHAIRKKSGKCLLS